MNNMNIRTVGELKRFLDQYPDEMFIYTPGFDEMGYDSLDLYEQSVDPEPKRKSGHYGRFGESEDEAHKSLIINMSWPDGMTG